MKSFSIIFVLVTFCCLVSSCGEKLNEGIGYLKNDTNKELVVGNYNKALTDSILCTDLPYIEYSYAEPGLTIGLSTRHLNPSAEPDLSQEHIYIFNSDSLNKYRKLKLCDGIVNHCLIKRIVIQLNKVKSH